MNAPGSQTFGPPVLASNGELIIALASLETEELNDRQLDLRGMSSTGELRWTTPFDRGAGPMAIDHAGRLVVVSSTLGSDGATIYLFDPQDGTELAASEHEVLRHAGSTVAISPDGRIDVLHLAEPPFDQQVDSFTIESYDTHGMLLGSSTFAGVGLPPLAPGYEWGNVSSARALDNGLTLTGHLQWGIDFGAGPVYAAGCEPYDPVANNLARGGADGFAVRFDWVPH